MLVPTVHSTVRGTWEVLGEVNWINETTNEGGTGIPGKCLSESVMMEWLAWMTEWGYFAEWWSQRDGHAPMPTPCTALPSCLRGKALVTVSSETGVFRAIFSWLRDCRWFLPWFLSISWDHCHFHQQKFPGNSLNYQTYTRKSEIRYNMSMSYLLTYELHEHTPFPVKTLLKG